MCESSVPAKAGGTTSDPWATDRTVRTRSSTVASFMMNPCAPALTNAMISSGAGSRSSTITLAAGAIARIYSTQRQLSGLSKPASTSTTWGVSSRTWRSPAAMSAATATTFRSGCAASMASSPSRTSRLSSMISTRTRFASAASRLRSWGPCGVSATPADGTWPRTKALTYAPYRWDASPGCGNLVRLRGMASIRGGNFGVGPHLASDGIVRVAGGSPGVPLAVRRPGCIFKRNSDAVIPKARRRAARLCLGGSESRNRLSGGDPAWPDFSVGWTHNRSRPMKRLALALCLAALAAPPLDAQDARPAAQTGASAADSEWTLVEATDWPTRARGLIGKRVEVFGNLSVDPSSGFSTTGVMTGRFRSRIVATISFERIGKEQVNGMTENKWLLTCRGVFVRGVVVIVGAGPVLQMIDISFKSRADGVDSTVALAAPALNVEAAPATQTGGSTEPDSGWTLVQASEWRTRAPGLIGRRVELSGDLSTQFYVDPGESFSNTGEMRGTSWRDPLATVLFDQISTEQAR